MENVITRDDILTQDAAVTRQRTIDIARRFAKRCGDVLNAEHCKFKLSLVRYSTRNFHDSFLLNSLNCGYHHPPLADSALACRLSQAIGAPGSMEKILLSNGRCKHPSRKTLKLYYFRVEVVKSRKVRKISPHRSKSWWLAYKKPEIAAREDTRPPICGQS